MVRFMAENKIVKVEDIKEFYRLGYVYREDLSTKDRYVFVQSRFEEELTYLVLHRWLGITNTYK